jgi:FAD synthase
VAQHREDGEDKVSSTVVRNVIAEGDMERAARLLGARYMLSGVAHEGAIAAIDEYKMLPPSGEYRCSVECEGVTIPAILKIADRTATLSANICGRVVVIF